MRLALLLSLLAVCLALPAWAQQPVAPRACALFTVTTGTTAVSPITGPVNGGYILNPLSATDQGIGAAEVLYVDPVATATTTGNGTNNTLQPGQVYNLVPGSNQTVSVNAATSGHKFVCERW